jgi:tRNA 2-thiouridine synthesizing protein A
MINSNQNAMDNNEHIIDLRGLRCPLPAIRIRKHLASAIAIKTITILLTDESALQDIPLAVADLHWVSLGAELVELSPTASWKLRLAAHD